MQVFVELLAANDRLSGQLKCLKFVLVGCTRFMMVDL